MGTESSKLRHNCVRVVFNNGRKDLLFGGRSNEVVLESGDRGISWRTPNTDAIFFYPWSSVDHLEYFND